MVVVVVAVCGRSGWVGEAPAVEEAAAQCGRSVELSVATDHSARGCELRRAPLVPFPFA